jgi:mRNA interferase RelE/StbE
VKLIYTTRFAKDLRPIQDRSLKANVQSVLDRMQVAKKLEDIGDVVKMKGSKNAFRARVGEYRIGFFLDSDTITLGRFANRKDIYKLFP